jgi:hypothetical protein
MIGGQYSEQSIQKVLQLPKKNQKSILTQQDTHFAILLPHTCSQKAWTCAIFKNFRGMKAAKQPRFIPISPKRMGQGQKPHRRFEILMQKFGYANIRPIFVAIGEILEVHT